MDLAVALGALVLSWFLQPIAWVVVFSFAIVLSLWSIRRALEPMREYYLRKLERAEIIAERRELYDPEPDWDALPEDEHT